MRLTSRLWIVSLLLLLGAPPLSAQSLVGKYHGTALIGDTSGLVIPEEFVQSVDLAMTIERTQEGAWAGTVSFRRPVRNPNTGRTEEAQGPLVYLTVDDAGEFVAQSAPIRFTLDERTAERTVYITGRFVRGEGQCIPTIEAEYYETIRGLAFRPLALSGPLSMARTQATAADTPCLTGS